MRVTWSITLAFTLLAAFVLTACRPQTISVDATMTATQQAELLSKALEQHLITQEEANIFNEVYALLTPPINRDTLPDALQALVSQGEISQLEADAFLEIYNRLDEAKLLN